MVVVGLACFACVSFGVCMLLLAHMFVAVLLMCLAWSGTPEIAAAILGF